MPTRGRLKGSDDLPGAAGDMPDSRAVDDSGCAVPSFLKSAPTCPSGPYGNAYSIDTSGTVDDCGYGTIAHVHF